LPRSVWISTEGARENLLHPDHPMHGIRRAIPLQRLGTPEDVVNAAVFLASDEAAYVTGANLVVDGGWSCVLPGAA
jgi:NAD(P)-dependent dehydrogenase (short-subunit alcohol dehydrogenase family)